MIDPRTPILVGCGQITDTTSQPSSERSRVEYRRIMQDLVNRGAEAIVLGCTEIALLVGPQDASVPMFDTTLIHAHADVDADTLLLAGLLLAAGLPLILPQMNARSLYLAGMLAFACAGSARRLAIAGVLELISLCSYMEAIFNCTIIPMNVLSLMAIACATVILLELLDKLGIKGALSRESNA